MPGLVPRSESIAKNAAGVKMDLDTQPEVMHEKSHHSHGTGAENQQNGIPLTNGDHLMANGIYSNGISPTPPDVQERTSAAVDRLIGQLPPEIEHITFGYTPLSTLISRLVQETFIGLADVINDMSETPIPQSGQNGQINHVNHQMTGNDDTSQVNVQKKLRLLNFAGDRRAQFIKILILSKWARRAEEVSKIIDLNVWSSNRLQEYQDCISWMGELKRRLIPLRDPNPDIKTALEVLSLGKASWLPDLGYIPPEPLTSEQLLSALRKINTLLSIRLNLHETIPPLFRDFAIASGRVTFRIVDEFEVDLSIADEDPSSQFFFIDFRFSFSPIPTDLLAGRLRDEIESRANDVLKRDGLQGLFNFLHNLVLTHKLRVLRNQAYEMMRSYWAENLIVEAVHRSVVVQYWTNRPGGKNWIEIGLKSGRETRLAKPSSVPRIPHIAIRWFRGGTEVDDAKIDLNVGYLSLAAILKQIMALHTSYIFEGMAAKMKEALLYSSGSLRLKCIASATEPMDASILIQLTATRAVKLVKEPISGRFAILPSSQVNGQAEFDLNRLPNPAADGSSQLARLRSSASVDEVETTTNSLGWESFRSLNPNRDIVKRFFGKAIQRVKFFKRQPWTSQFLLAFTTSMDGDSWWVVELSENGQAQDAASLNVPAGPTVQGAYRVTLPELGEVVAAPSFAILARIDKLAAGTISNLVNARHLQAQKIPYKMRQLPATDQRHQPSCIFVSFSDRRTPPLLRSSPVPDISWAHEIVKLEYRGLSPSGHRAVYVATAHLSKNFSSIRDVVSKIPSLFFRTVHDSDTGLESEAISLPIVVKVGETSIPTLINRLAAIGLLLDCISAIKFYHAKIESISLQKVSFTYKSHPSLSATVHFPTDAPMRLSLSSPNPHLRILDHLTTLLGTQGLTEVLSLIRTTQSLLDGLCSLEASHPNGGIAILTRSEEWFQVRYSSPYAKGGYDIHMRQRRDDPKWAVAEESIKKGESGSQEFEDQLKGLLRRRKQNEWFGVNGGMIAEVSGVEDMLKTVDQVWRLSQHMPGDSRPGKRKAETDIVEID
ncbi:mediator complex subunit [Puttea exsequens]|nr:mediator complex subunit [Puttea exsequens]